MKTIISFLVFSILSAGVFADQTKLVGIYYPIVNDDSVTFQTSGGIGAKGCPNAIYIKIFKRPNVQAAALSAFYSGHRMAARGECKTSTKGIWYFIADSIWFLE